MTLRRAAMGTWFEARLLGDDRAHLDAVAAAVLDEVERVERRFSRFDPRSELSRVNREAAARAVLVDAETLDVLLACRAAWEATDGAFDVAATFGGTFAEVELDPDRRLVRFHHPGLGLDLGGFAKGYALDRAREILAAQGVACARLHGGTSSVLALGPGEHPHDGGWPVSVRDPSRPPEDGREAGRVVLRDEGFSCSSTFGHTRSGGPSDVIDPRRGRPLGGPGACAVLAATAAEAETLSTALLVMGRRRAAEWLRARTPAAVRAAWITPAPRDDTTPGWDWLT